MSKNERFFCHAKTRFSDEGLDRDLRKLRDGNEWFFAPHERATIPGVTTMFTIEPRSGRLDGRMSPYELTALLMVHNETRILAESYRDDPMAAEGIRTLLGLDNEDSIKEVLEGMADFAYDLANVAGVRKWLLQKGKEVTPVDLPYWLGRFMASLEEDGFLLGQAVALKLVEVIKELSSRNVVDMEGIERWVDRYRGAELAKSLYLNALSESWGL